MLLNRDHFEMLLHAKSTRVVVDNSKETTGVSHQSESG